MIDNHFDTESAERYDDPSPSPEDQAALARSVAALCDLAGGGPVLECAMGTGRVALPLAETGPTVAGIEFSPAMLAVLRRKPGADKLTLVEGDMATARVAGSFGLVFLVFNTIGNLATQDSQVTCLENAALDLTARIAGLTLENRWGDWDGRAFDHGSAKHVSVWRKAN